MSSLREAASEFWKKSQHLQALPSPGEREKFALLVLVPARDNTPDPHRQRLLSRLIDRAVAP